MKNKFFTVLLLSIALLTLTSTSILAANMTKDQLLEVQKELKEESFYDGQIDGLYGPLTAKAIKNYQKENDLKVDARNIEDNYLLITKNNKDKSGGYIEMKLGVETLNEMKLTNNEYDMNETRDLNVGFSITGEYKYPVTDTQLVVGGGINQQINRSFKKSNEIKMNFTSLYSIGQYDIKNTPVYLFGKLGYNFINIDEEYFDDGVKPEINGGMYYGLGSGFTFGENDQFLIEGVYSVNNGEIVYKVPDHTIINKLKCSTLQISVGMRF
ncbi:MAG: peptidoglycan-binding domain-containing protein [Bacillota bacterium]